LAETPPASASFFPPLPPASARREPIFPPEYQQPFFETKPQDRLFQSFPCLIGVVQAIDHGGLDAGKAEVESVSFVERGVEPVFLRIAL
jgi:hypothetical protein